MHEASLASSLLETVQATAADHGMIRVTGLVLRVGGLTMVVPELLRTAFDLAARGSLAEGATLDIVAVPVVARCRACQAQITVDDWVFCCPTCGSGDTHVESGRELDLVELSGEQGAQA
jgi:hydrogenase nickel incorporation protein HypA/HybF